MTGAVGVIPARYASTRFPGKILADLCGKPLLHWVVERARQAEALDHLLVATDDERIAAAAEEVGAEAVLTRSDHPSGTDRIAEAVAGQSMEVVINIQGDEPLIDPALIDRTARVLLDGAHWDMATAAVPFQHLDEVRDPFAVKVVIAKDGAALFFSRAFIPHVRDAEDAPTALGGDGPYWRHLGLYGYRRTFLEKLVAEPPCQTEWLEKLEQLRALHIGARMHVLKATQQAPGVDTPEDLECAKRALRDAGLI